MSKYSSDSDSSDGHSRKKGKSSRKARSPSSSSSDSGSRHRRRKHRSGHSRRRSHSSDVSHKSSRRDRDRSSERSHEKSKSRYTRRSRSSSRNRTRRRSRSRSHSKGRSRRKSSSHSPSRSHARNHSRRSRSRSKGHSRKRSSSGSSSGSVSKDRTQRERQLDSSSQHGKPQTSPTVRSQTSVQQSSFSQTAPEEALTERLQKAIWAAKTADQQLRNQGLIGAKREVSPTRMVLEAINRSNLLDEINSDGFSPRQFNSNSKRDEYPVVVDLASQPCVPTPALVKQDPKAIFHSSLLVDEPQRLEKWIKRLYNIRQCAINGEPLPTF